MSALTGPRNTIQQSDQVMGAEFGIPIGAAIICHQGGMVGPQGGFAVPGGIKGTEALLLVQSTTGGSGITFTSAIPGVVGNATKITYATPAGGTTTVTFVGQIITVNPKTGETNNGLLAVLAATPGITGLVTFVLTGTGTDVLVARAQAPLAGGVTGPDAVIAGVAEFEYDNSGNNPGGLHAGNGTVGAVVVQVKRGVFKFNNSTSTDLINQANILQPCYAADDQTVALTNGGSTRPVAGLIYQVDTDGVWVEITGANPQPA